MRFDRMAACRKWLSKEEIHLKENTLKISWELNCEIFSDYARLRPSLELMGHETYKSLTW